MDYCNVLLHLENVVQDILVITAKWNTTSVNLLRVRMEAHALTVWGVIHVPAAEVTPVIPVNSRYVNFSDNENNTRVNFYAGISFRKLFGR